MDPDVPPYEIVVASALAGIERPEEQPWVRTSRSVCCVDDHPLLMKPCEFIEGLSKTARRFLIGQCPACLRVHFREVGIRRTKLEPLSTLLSRPQPPEHALAVAKAVELVFFEDRPWTRVPFPRGKQKRRLCACGVPALLERYLLEWPDGYSYLFIGQCLRCERIFWAEQTEAQ